MKKVGLAVASVLLLAGCSSYDYTAEPVDEVGEDDGNFQCFSVTHFTDDGFTRKTENVGIYCRDGETP